MAARTSLTGVAVNSGYVQLLHVGDDSGIESTLHQIFDGNGTGTPLKLGTVSMTITLGGSAGNDLIVDDGGGTILLVEGDDNKVTWNLDGTANADWLLQDAGGDMVLFETDTRAFTFTGDATAGSDFIIHDGTNEILNIATDQNTSTYKTGHQFLCPTDGLQILNAASDKLSFYDIATPIAQPAKASFNNWAAATDVAGALAALGLVDAA